jgi:stage II sporulation protein D
MKRFVCAIAVLMAVSSSRFCACAPETPAQQAPEVRVLIADGADSVALYIKGRYTITSPASGAVLLSGPQIETRISSAKDGIAMRGRTLDTRAVRISAPADSKIFIDKRPFRGELDVVRKADGKLMVVNVISVEDYLYGVLYNEVSHRWPMEALKAQAIASRTFALYQAKQARLQPYDLRSDVYSQVYSGSDFERRSTRMAVDVTRGKVLVYKGELLPAYYHAACSGGTEDASALWNIDIPPLKGVECDFCRDSKYYRWINNMPLRTVGKRLADAGYKIGSIISIRTLSKNGSGRVERLSITDTEGRSIAVSGKDFRQIIGPNEIRSAKFDVSVVPGQLVIEGRGWGHGVGMCQWGAFGQAKAGKKADEILGYYYPGAEVTTIGALKR